MRSVRNLLTGGDEPREETTGTGMPLHELLSLLDDEPRRRIIELLDERGAMHVRAIEEEAGADFGELGGRFLYLEARAVCLRDKDGTIRPGPRHQPVSDALAELRRRCD